MFLFQEIRVFKTVTRDSFSRGHVFLLDRNVFILETICYFTAFMI